MPGEILLTTLRWNVVFFFLAAHRRGKVLALTSGTAYQTRIKRTMNMQRRNFGDNIRLNPKTAYTPATEQEVVEILDRHHGQRIRCIGRLHSWSRVVECNDVLLDLRHLNHVNPVADSEARLVSVGAGCQIKHLLAELERLKNWTLPSLGLITEQAVAGAVSTGTHGSGRNSLSQYVVSVRIAHYDSGTGKATVTEISSGDPLRAARCSLGCLGVIVSVTMQCRPSYNVEEAWHEHKQLADVIEAEREYPLQQFFLVPWRWTYMSQSRRETERRKSKSARLYHWYRYLTIDITMLVLIVLMVRVLRINSLVRFMFRRIIPAFVIRDWHVVGASTPQLVMEHEMFRHIEMELFVQKSNLESAMSYAQQTLCLAAGMASSIDETFREQIMRADLETELNQIKGTYCHHFPICVRKVLMDDTLISMASASAVDTLEESQEAWYAITFTCYCRKSEQAAFEQLGRFLTRTMAILFSARPHWGKLHYMEPDQIPRLYPQFEAFQQCRRTLDPDGYFLNDWMNELLET